MFKDVVDRAQCSWMTAGMTTARWMTEVPVVPVRISDLIATQPGVLLHALLGELPASVSGDPVPHVVSFNGRLYLEDGHHRAVRSALRGDDLIDARVLRVASCRHIGGDSPGVASEP